NIIEMGAKEVQEKDVIDAYEAAKKELKKIIDEQIKATKKIGIQGDGDPLDICVLAEKVFPQGNVLLEAVPIGGLRMIDKGEADDKIIAVLEGDGLYGGWTDLDFIPKAVVNRLVHYFETYKLAPGATTKPIEITHVFGREEAHLVIERAQEDYTEKFGALQKQLADALA
ncbi:MAG: inorganic diphosphatase, partial [Acidobacteriota bacterium]